MSTRNFPRSSEVRRIARESKINERATNAQAAIDTYMATTKVAPSRLTDGFKRGMEKVERESAFERMASIRGINLIAFNEKEYPDQYDKAVSMLDSAINGIKSNFHDLIEASGVDYYDMAQAIYDRSMKKGVIVDGKQVDVELASGTQIPLTQLIEAIEDISDHIGKKGLIELKAKRPFFFQ